MSRHEELAGTLGSVLLHAAALAAMLLTLPAPVDRPDEPEAILMDIVTIDELTALDKAAAPSMAAAPRETVEAPPNSEPELQPSATSAVTPSDAPPLPDARPQDEQRNRLDARKLATVLDKSIAEADRKRPRIDDLAKTLEDLAPAERLRRAQTSASLAQAMKSMVERCWNPPLGGVDIDKLRVTIRLALRQDGTLLAAPETVAHAGVNPRNQAYANAFAESARRAILRCAPYLLPQEDYALWREQELTFDSSDIVQ